MYYFDKSFKYENQKWYVLMLDKLNTNRKPLYEWADKELISPEGKKNYWENIIKDDSKRNIQAYAIPKDKIEDAKKTLKFGEPNFIMDKIEKVKIRFLDSQLDEDDKIKNIKLEYTIDTEYFKDEPTLFADDPSYYFDS